MNQGKFYESEFEGALVQLLRENGWQYTFGGDCHRRLTDVILEDDLQSFLTAHYGAKGLTPNDYDTIAAKVRNISGDTYYRSMVNAVCQTRDGFDFTPSVAGASAFHLDLIDFEHPEKNIFRAVNQFEVEQGTKNRRPDIVLFVNGIPVVIIELKNPTKPNATVEDAYYQITSRYRDDIPLLMRYCAIGVISDAANTRMGTTVSEFEYFYAWKKVENDDKPGMGLDDVHSLVKGALAPARLLEIYRDYLYFPDKAQGEEKEIAVVCRYPQFFATRKMRDSILGNLQSRGGKGQGGIYFGATGCGKTYTMLFLTRQLALRCRKTVESPTVLIIVDREDLENQSAKLFCTSKTFLCDEAVKVFESREELGNEMRTRKSGGVYITTIQKFTESMACLTDRSNVICMSDEAHRTQNNLGAKRKTTDLGTFISYGFAKYLRDALPKATYCGFTGTPVEDAIAVFGGIVDEYTMIQSQADGITLPIVYDPRLARVLLDEDKAKQIEQYYALCAEEGASEEDIKASKDAMSKMQVILGDPERQKRMIQDIVLDFEKRMENTPDRVQKAMIVTSDRLFAYNLYKMIEELRPEWCKPRKAINQIGITADDFEKLQEIPFVNVVATSDERDSLPMRTLLGTKERRKSLAEAYKDDKSNFRIAIVVDMWITGFDCPSLTVLYNDKPLQRHTLIQTISRVNRRYKSKEKGIIVDYIGIRENLKSAMKQYGGGGLPDEHDVEQAYKVLVTELTILKDMCTELDFSPFIKETFPLVRLQFLQKAAEFILLNSVEDPEKKIPSLKTKFAGHVKRLHSAYDICSPAGRLSEEESIWANCFMGIQSYILKLTARPHDVDSMNKDVEKMVQEALKCTGVENVLGFTEGKAENIFGDNFLVELDKIKMPNTKFQLLVKMLRKVIREYKKTNKLKAEAFEKMLEATVEKYNTRGKLNFANTVATNTINAVNDVVNEEINRLAELLKEIQEDQNSFQELGITFEEKAFYDILVNLRDTHKFEYPDEKCKELAQKIKELIDDKAIYADWLNNDNLKDQLSSDLLVLLYNNGYPPEWNDEVFARVLDQVENFKRNED